MDLISTRTLECGCRLVVERMPAVKSAALTWLVPLGTAQEPDGLQGLAAVTAEMLLRGAGPLDSREFADSLERLGASRRTDVGTHHLSISSTMLGERLPQVMPLIADMVRRPRLDDASFGPSLELAKQGLESLADDPQERAVLAARARHWASPINRSSYGTPGGLNTLTHADVVESWRSGALPGGSIISVAGSVEPDAVADQLESLLEGWSGSARAVELTGAPPRGYAHEQDPSNQVQIVLLHDAPPESEATSVLERVVVAVLSGGMSGRLFSEVREKRGLCYTVSASYSSDRDYARVLNYVGTTPQRAQESLDVLWSELNRIGEGVTEEELRRGIVGLKSRVVFSGESTTARAGALAGDIHRLGKARSLRQLADRLDAVTLDDVNTYLKKRAMGRVTIQTLGPEALTSPEE